MTQPTDELLSKPDSRAGQLQRALLKVLEEHRADDALPTNGNFLWYELEGLGVVDKNKRRGKPGVKRGQDQDLNEALTHLREVGLVPWDWIDDETRTMYVYDGYPSIAAGLLERLARVTLDPWQGDGMLILCESSSLAGPLRRLADEYRCRIAGCRGQTSGFLRTQVAPWVQDNPRILYVGDFDFCGDDIENHIRRVLSEYGSTARWERVALTQAQVDDPALNLRRFAIQKRDRR